MSAVPVRVGFWGFGRRNTFHYEQLCLLPGVTFGPVLCRDALADLPRPLMGTTVPADVAAAQPQLVFVESDTPPSDRSALSALSDAGGVLVCDWSETAVATPGRWPPHALERTDRVSFCARHRLEPGFLAARSALASGEIGPLRHLAYTLWQHAADSPLLPSRQADAADPTSAAITQHLLRHLREVFDQLLLLAGTYPTEIHARGRLVGTPDALVGATVLCRFESGLTASLDVDLATWAAADSGWLITGQTGGYARQTLYSSATDGEIQDLPLEVGLATPEAVYGPLLNYAAGRGTNPVEPAVIAAASRLGDEVLRQIQRQGE